LLAERVELEPAVEIVPDDTVWGLTETGEIFEPVK
jgi:hypothetical protein